MKTAYLGLGSNLGDRGNFLRAAVAQLRSETDIRVGKISSIYETNPVGVTAQPRFLNCVAAIETFAAPLTLLRIVRKIEDAQGRERREHWGPRTLDLDVLWYEGVTSDAAELTLPHPRMKERSFVLTPLAEIAPDLPLDGERVELLAGRLEQAGIARIGPWETVTAVP